MNDEEKEELSQKFIDWLKREAGEEKFFIQWEYSITRNKIKQWLVYPFNEILNFYIKRTVAKKNRDRCLIALKLNGFGELLSDKTDERKVKAYLLKQISLKKQRLEELQQQNLKKAENTAALNHKISILGRKLDIRSKKTLKTIEKTHAHVKTAEILRQISDRITQLGGALKREVAPPKIACDSFLTKNISTKLVSGLRDIFSRKIQDATEIEPDIEVLWRELLQTLNSCKACDYITSLDTIRAGLAKNNTADVKIPSESEIFDSSGAEAPSIYYHLSDLFTDVIKSQKRLEAVNFTKNRLLVELGNALKKAHPEKCLQLLESATNATTTHELIAMQQYISEISTASTMEIRDLKQASNQKLVDIATLATATRSLLSEPLGRLKALTTVLAEDQTQFRILEEKYREVKEFVVERVKTAKRDAFKERDSSAYSDSQICPLNSDMAIETHKICDVDVSGIFDTDEYRGGLAFDAAIRQLMETCFNEYVQCAVGSVLCRFYPSGSITHHSPVIELLRQDTNLNDLIGRLSLLLENDDSKLIDRVKNVTLQTQMAKERLSALKGMIKEWTGQPAFDFLDEITSRSI